MRGRGDCHHPLFAAVASARGDRKPGAWEGKISYSPDAFDPLTDLELKDVGFE